MASDVDIGNLSLAHLGDEATVASFNPPEGSVQAENCARFYYIARDSLLEMHPWNWATKRISGAGVASQAGEWAYAYSMPANCLSVFAVLPPNANVDSVDVFSYPLDIYGNESFGPNIPPRADLLQPYSIEALDSGEVVIYTNQAQAQIRYICRITDSTKFSPLFVVTLSRLLSSYMAGPVIKGDQGRNEAKGQYQMFLVEMNKAQTSDVRQRRVASVYDQQQPLPSWMRNR